MEDAIGIFDSGVGGLSLWSEIVRRMPEENTIYVADRRYFPYGEKTDNQIRRRATRITQFLINHGSSLVVLACNTATVAALPYLRSRFPIPFVGVEPAIKPAAKESRTKEIAVLSTTKTASSKRQKMLVETHAKGTTVHRIGAPLLVGKVENGEINSPSTFRYLKIILAKKNLGKSDRIVLGCTHFPFLSEAIRETLGKKIRIIDPTQAVARHVRELRPKKGMIRGRHEFFTTKDVAHFRKVAEKLLGQLPGETAELNL